MSKSLRTGWRLVVQVARLVGNKAPSSKTMAKAVPAAWGLKAGFDYVSEVKEIVTRDEDAEADSDFQNVAYIKATAKFAIDIVPLTSSFVKALNAKKVYEGLRPYNAWGVTLGLLTKPVVGRPTGQSRSIDALCQFICCESPQRLAKTVFDIFVSHAAKHVIDLIPEGKPRPKLPPIIPPPDQIPPSPNPRPIVLKDPLENVKFFESCLICLGLNGSCRHLLATGHPDILVESLIFISVGGTLLLCFKGTCPKCNTEYPMVLAIGIEKIEKVRIEVFD